MHSEAARGCEPTSGEAVLYMALELSARSWKVLLASSRGGRRERRVAAGDVAQLVTEIAGAKRKLGLPAEARTVSCYEAGRDGFWLHRALVANGVESLVVDSSSIEVPQRARRRKTDRIDLYKLMSLLVRYLGGERRVWSVVRVPDAEVEDVRQLSRGIERLKTERRQHRMRIQSLLAKMGIRLARIGGKGWAERVGALGLGPHLAFELVQEGERLALVEQQLAELKARREALVTASDSKIARSTRALRRLGAIAEESSFVFATELLGWRTFANRRELAGAVGIAGTPFQSGECDREQGISKAGNGRMRTMLVEIAWCWIKLQPQSVLSRWWRRRFGAGNKRTRRIGLVALARKLLVALWRYLESGIVPEGAALKAFVPEAAAA